MQRYSFETKLWVWAGGTGSWHFITVPKPLSAKIKEKIVEGKKRRGFGSWRVKAKIGKTSWDTSIFPTKEGVYLLPVKAAVRKKEGIFEKDIVSVSITLLQ